MTSLPFASKTTSANAKIAAVYGETLTHTDVDGVETAIADGRFIETTPEPKPDDDGEVLERTATATIEAADVAQPAPGETITRGSETWTIDTVAPVYGDLAWELALTRSEPVEKARRTFRLRR